MLAQVKFSLLSKILFQRTFPRVSKLYRFHRGYSANFINSGYFVLAKQTASRIRIPLHQEAKLKNEFMIKKKEVGSFSALWNRLLIIARIFVISFIVSGLLTYYWITQLIGLRTYPVVYLKGIEFLGPTFIKFGQWMSTRRDLFPLELCNCLSHLQRETSAHSWYYTRHILEAAYGPDWRQIFIDFEPTPVGSGCCAQVHRAFLNANYSIKNVNRKAQASTLIETAEYFYLGHFIDLLDEKLNFNSSFKRKSYLRSSTSLRPVAVKILHPQVKERLERDLSILHLFTNFITCLVPSLEWLSITDCINEFTQIMEKQVDLEYEAENLVKFTKNFSKHPEVCFPQPFKNLSYNQILVETFHEGQPINDYLKGENYELRHKLAKIGLHTVFKMIFEDNFVHCDLHPGNIIVQENPSKRRFFKFLEYFNNTPNPRIVIFDCGLVTTMSKACRENFYDVFESVVNGNGKRAAELIMNHSLHQSSDPNGFMNTLDNIVNSHLQKGIKLENINVGHVMSEFFTAMVRYQVKQDGSFSSVVLSIAVIEGLGRSLDPSIDLIRELTPYLSTNRFNDLLK